MGVRIIVEEKKFTKMSSSPFTSGKSSLLLIAWVVATNAWIEKEDNVESSVPCPSPITGKYKSLSACSERQVQQSLSKFNPWLEINPAFNPCWELKRCSQDYFEWRPHRWVCLKFCHPLIGHMLEGNTWALQQLLDKLPITYDTQVILESNNQWNQINNGSQLKFHTAYQWH